MSENKNQESVAVAILIVIGLFGSLALCLAGLAIVIPELKNSEILNLYTNPHSGLVFLILFVLGASLCVFVNKSVPLVALTLPVLVMAGLLMFRGEPENQLEQSDGRKTFSIDRDVGRAQTVIDRNILDQLCGDSDGCQIRLTMREYENMSTNVSLFGGGNTAFFKIEEGTERWRVDNAANWYEDDKKRLILIQHSNSRPLNPYQRNSEKEANNFIFTAWNCAFMAPDDSNQDFLLVRTLNLHHPDGRNFGNGYKTDCFMTIID